MNDKTQARLRRARKSRVRMRTAGDVRLTVNRTPRHIYAQIINGEGNRVLAQASTLDKTCEVVLLAISKQRQLWVSWLQSALKQLA